MAWEDDPNDLDYVIDSTEEMYVKRPIIFGDAAMTAKRWKIPYRAATLMINQVLRDVNRDDLYISKTTLENWANKIGEEAVEEYEKEHQCLTCIKFDGKKSKRAIGNNKFERQHHLTVIKEGFQTPDPKYIHHAEAGETGLEMAATVYDVIVKSQSKDSLVAIGSGKTYFQCHRTMHKRHYRNPHLFFCPVFNTCL